MNAFPLASNLRPLGLCVILALGSYPVHKAAAQDSLPPQMQADMLKNRIVSDIEAHDLKGAVSDIESYR